MNPGVQPDLTTSARYQTLWHNEVLKHLNWLRSVIRARLGDQFAVEDVLNDVVVDALAVENPREKIQFVAPWLYRLAIHKTLLFRRKCGRRNRAYEAKAWLAQAQYSSVHFIAPLEGMLEAERHQAVRDAMQRINGKDSEILSLKYVHDWDYQTISENLGIDYWKVVHRLRRARNRLRTELLKNVNFRSST